MGAALVGALAHRHRRRRLADCNPPVDGVVRSRRRAQRVRPPRTPKRAPRPPPAPAHPAPLRPPHPQVYFYNTTSVKFVAQTGENVVVHNGDVYWESVVDGVKNATPAPASCSAFLLEDVTSADTLVAPPPPSSAARASTPPPTASRRRSARAVRLDLRSADASDVLPAHPRAGRRLAQLPPGAEDRAAVAAAAARRAAEPGAAAEPAAGAAVAAAGPRPHGHLFGRGRRRRRRRRLPAREAVVAVAANGLLPPASHRCQNRPPPLPPPSPPRRRRSAGPLSRRALSPPSQTPPLALSGVEGDRVGRRPVRRRHPPVGRPRELHDVADLYHTTGAFAACHRRDAERRRVGRCAVRRRRWPCRSRSGEGVLERRRVRRRPRGLRRRHVGRLGAGGAIPNDARRSSPRRTSTSSFRTSSPSPRRLADGSVEAWGYGPGGRPRPAVVNWASWARCVERVYASRAGVRCEDLPRLRLGVGRCRGGRRPRRARQQRRRHAEQQRPRQPLRGGGGGVALRVRRHAEHGRGGGVGRRPAGGSTSNPAPSTSWARSSKSSPPQPPSARAAPTARSRRDRFTVRRRRPSVRVPGVGERAEGDAGGRDGLRVRRRARGRRRRAWGDAHNGGALCAAQRHRLHAGA